MAEKQLLIEASEFGLICNLSNDEKNRLTESLKVSKRPNDCLLVKGVPSTRLDIKNQNGRVYPTALMQKAIEEARPQMESKMLVCSGDEHPETSYPRPGTISHVVVNAYIKNVLIESNGKKERQNVLFCDFLVLPTVPYGVNMQKFILEGIGCGISIRGTGSCDPDGTVTEYQFLGADLVGMPSSSVYLSTAIGESVSVSVIPENTLTETYIVSASATNVVRDLDQALALSQQIDSANFGTVKKTSTKLDSEVDPKTGAETTMVTLETETEDEVSELDQALAMAKQAMMNGKADIDSVTIENVKEEQPKESTENKLENDTTLNEDDGGHYANLPHLTPITNYILQNFDKNSDAYKVAFRIQNDLITGRLKDRNAALEELKKYVTLKNDFEEAEYIPESEINTTITEETNHIAEDVKIAFKVLPDIIKEYPENHEIHIRAKDLLNRLENCFGVNGFMPGSPIEDVLKDCVDLYDDYQFDMLKDWREKSLKGESTIKEAKEEKQEDPNKGKQYVLKTNQGFVAMDGNAISFVDNPKDAIHFVKGNEESGVIHLSGINKILNTMGILDSDIEKYFKKDSIDISAHDDVNVQAAESDGVKVEECGTTPMTEENGSNTRFKATIKINGANGESTEDVPVSAVDMEGINAEVANLYDMKKQKADGELVITVTDTASGQQFMLNPETRQIEPMNAQMESAGDIEQDGNKLSMEVDDDNKVEKEFDTPAQAAVAKAGIESGKLGGDVLLSEDNNQYNDPMLYMNDIHDFLLSGGNISDEDMDKVWSIFNNWRDEKMPTKDACDQLEVIRKQIIDNTPNIMYSDNPIGEADDEESDTAKCAWCGEEFEKSALRKEKDLGYLCNTCARGIASREGPLTFEEADNEIPVKTDYSYENIEPGWYASAPSIGFVGPYDTEEELRNVLGKEVCEIADSNKGLVNIDHVEDDDALAAESTKIDEVMFNEPGEASDPFVEKPLKDSVGNVMVEVDNINWDNEDLYNNFLANYEPGDPVSFGDIESKVKDLPSSAVIKINMDELPDDVDIHTFKDCVLDSLGKTYAMKVNDADIISVNYIN